MAEAGLKFAAILLPPPLQDFSFRDTHNLATTTWYKYSKPGATAARAILETHAGSECDPAATTTPDSDGIGAAANDREPRPPVSPSPAEL